MKHYLFCLRHFNDIDNIVPAIYFLLKKSEVKATILIYSLDYPYKDDQSLNFIAAEFPEQVRILWIGDIADYPYKLTTRPLLRALHSRCRRFLGLPTLQKEIAKSGHSKLLKPKLIPVLEQWGQFDTVVFDQNRTSVIAGLIDVFHQYGVSRIISLPVSPWINFNVLRQVDFIDISADLFRRKHDYSGFDEIGQVDAFYSDSLNRFFELLGETSPFAGKTKILGAIRFSQEWLSIRDTYIKRSHTLKDDGRPKVLILPSHPKNNSFWDEYLRTLQFLGQFNNFQFLLKPHTRYGENFRNLPGNIALAQEQDSAELIDWADIILYWSTSVALEGFQKNKVMVCLDYINANNSLYSVLNAGFQCRSKDDLFWILMHHPNLDGYPGFDSQGIERVRSKIINGGQKGSITEAYTSFIQVKADI